jgi:hypothetical protein
MSSTMNKNKNKNGQHTRKNPTINKDIDGYGC